MACISGTQARRLRGHHDLAALIRTLDRSAMDSRKEVAEEPSHGPPLTGIQQRAGHPPRSRRIDRFVNNAYDLIASTFSIMQATLSNGYRWSSAVSA